MFEVGKKYKQKEAVKDIYECMWRNDKYVLLVSKTGPWCTEINWAAVHVHEYKNPVVHTRYIHWYKNRSGAIRAVVSDKKESESYFGHNCLKTDKVEYVEEQ